MCVYFPHLVQLVGVLFDEGSIEDLTFGRADHDQLPYFRRTATQAVMTLEEEEWEGKERGRRWRETENVEEMDDRNITFREICLGHFA